MKHIPTDIKLHSKSRIMEIHFADQTFMLPCEYLRVHSPSAEVQGHGPGQEVLQLGKEAVNITTIEPVGNYAIRLIYTDAHSTGLYSWDYLHELGTERVKKWQHYLQRLADNGSQRKAQSTDHYLQAAS